MLSWTIYKNQSLEKRYCLLYFALGSCNEKVLYKVFTRNILGIVRDHVKVYIFFRWKFYHKNQVHLHSNVFHKRIIILKLIFLYIEPESTLIFSKFTKKKKMLKQKDFEH